MSVQGVVKWALGSLEAGATGVSRSGAHWLAALEAGAGAGHIPGAVGGGATLAANTLGANWVAAGASSNLGGDGGGGGSHALPAFAEPAAAMADPGLPTRALLAETRLVAAHVECLLASLR